MRTGIDIVQTERIFLDDKFLQRIANEGEIAYAKGYKDEKLQRQSFAGLWATKEAVFKLLGLGKDSSVTFKNVVLFHEESGRPFVELNGIALKTFKELNLTQIEVSISHEKGYVVAVAVAI